MQDKIINNFVTLKEENEILKKLDEHASIKEIENIIYSIRKEFYEDKPVDIETFITDPYFLGESLNGILYPIWLNLLKSVHPSPFVNTFYEIILEAPLGSGKSYVGCISILYEIYKLILLCEPQLFYNLDTGTKIYFIIFSVTLDSADINWRYIRSFMKKSRFFNELGTKLSKAQSMQEQNVMKDIYVSLGSNTNHSISRAIFGGQLDEGNFQKESSNQAYENYDALITRTDSRFSSETGTPAGILWLCSSPTLESSFTKTRIEESKTNPNTLVVENITKWDVLKGTDKYKKTYKSGKYFPVFVGDSIREPFIIQDKETLSKYPKELILPVPMEHKRVFSINPKKALRDSGGRRLTVSGSLFKSKDEIKRLMTVQNKFKTNIDERFISISQNTLGNTGTGIIKLGMKSNINLIDYIVDKDFFKKPDHPWAYRFIHIDIGAKIDRCGISSSYSIYKNNIYYQNNLELEERKNRIFYNDFAIALEAEEGDEIPFSKIIDLLVYLKLLGYPIQLITTDQREGGRKLRQDLTQQGLNTDYLSMDTGRDNYDTFQDLCVEERCILCDVPLLFIELAELQDNGNNGKKPIINHLKWFTMVNGVKATKDISDSTAGSIISASKAQYVFNPALLFNEYAEQNQEKRNLERMVKRNKFKGLGNGLFGR